MLFRKFGDQLFYVYFPSFCGQIFERAFIRSAIKMDHGLKTCSELNKELESYFDLNFTYGKEFTPVMWLNDSAFLISKCGTQL